MAQWITEQEIKDSTVIQQNVDAYNFENEIEYSQRANFRPCLGKDLYDRINTEIDDASISTEIQALLDEMQQSLALWVFYHSLPNIHLKVTNKGIYRKADNTN